MAIKTLEQFTTEAQTEIDALKVANGGSGLKISVDGVVREYTDADYDQAVIDNANYNFNNQNKGYKKDRQESYPDIGDQLDLLYHDMTADKGDKTGEWYKAVKKVKDDNPKPS